MTSRRPKQLSWTEDAITLTLRVIHFQDVTLTALAVGIKTISTGQYDQFKKIYLDIIQRSVENLQRAADEVLEIKSKPGRAAKWYVLAADTEALTGIILRGIVRIRERDIRRNDWGVVIARLEESKHQLVEIQRKIIRILPPEAHPDEVYVSQRSILEVFDMAQTFNMGDGQFRWRRSRD